jgi:hypothetical protein
VGSLVLWTKRRFGDAARWRTCYGRVRHVDIDVLLSQQDKIKIKRRIKQLFYKSREMDLGMKLRRRMK